MRTPELDDVCFETFTAVDRHAVRHRPRPALSGLWESVEALLIYLASVAPCRGEIAGGAETVVLAEWWLQGFDMEETREEGPERGQAGANYGYWGLGCGPGEGGEEVVCWLLGEGKS